MGEENAGVPGKGRVLTHADIKRIKAAHGRCATLEIGLSMANKELDKLWERVGEIEARGNLALDEVV